jgi:pimeloyl-ACP methyl ester carboxylesterase
MVSKLLVIPPFLLLFLLWLAPILLLIVALWQRQRRPLSKIGIRQGWPTLRANLSWLLVAAGSGILTLIASGLTIASVQESVNHTGPLPYQVTLPAESVLPVEDVSFTGGDDLTLAAWFVPPQNGVTIILLHGYDGNRTEMLWHAEKLVEAGFGVLLYDARGTAESEGEYRSMGWQDTSDVAGAIAYLNQRSDVNSGQIGMVACSVGGQIALRSAAAYPEIDAVWADGPAVARAADYIGMDYWLNDLYMLIAHLSDGITFRRLGIAAPPPVSEVIGAIAPRPIMMLAGEQNGFEVARIAHYADLAGNNTGVWLVPEGYHCDGDELYPDEYAARMVDFFTTAFALEHE